MKKVNSGKLVLTLIAVSILLVSCSIDNSLYNARKLFITAQNRPLNQNGLPAPQSVDEYTKAIKKCGYVLTERKTSSQADDALILLAKCLYYKGNSQYQAKDQFVSFLANFPASPYLPEAVLYLSKCYRAINQQTEAENTLNTYIRDPKTAEGHPRALLLLADFAIQDKDYPKAKYWLEYLLSRYANSSSAKEAGFLLGKNFFEQKDYSNSLTQFIKIASAKGIPKSVKLDSRYYIALNLMYLNDLQQSLAVVKKLQKDENRPEKLAEVNLLLGRITLSLKGDEESVDLLKAIITTYPRTQSAAEAYFRLGEFYYYNQHDIQKAIDSYSKVKTEAANSPFSEEAANKQNALTKIYIATKPSLTERTTEFIDKYLESAENYYVFLSLPDSAFSVYNMLRTTPLRLLSDLDSLSLRKTRLLAERDSLNSSPDTLQTFILPITPDSLSYKNGSTFADSSIVAADSTATDSLMTDNKQTASNENAPKDKIALIHSQLRSYNNQITDIDNKKQKLESVIAEFSNNYIPYILFSKATLIFKTSADTTQINQVMSDLNNDYPGNKYTRALKQLLNNEPVTLTDAEFEYEKAILDKALSELEVFPDSALAALDSLSNSEYKEIKLQSTFRLGWHYLFEQQDTTKAKTYFNETLKTDRNSDYSMTLMRFYNGRIFTINLHPADSLSIKPPAPDSIKAEKDSLMLKQVERNQADKLNKDINPVLDDKHDEVNKGDLPIFPMPNDIIKKD